MSPPLPSIPSSSTQFDGPVESSPASQSPTTLASSEPRNKLCLVVGHIYPSSRASKQTIRIIKLHLDKDGYTWHGESFIGKSFRGKGYYGYVESSLREIMHSMDAKKRKEVAMRVSGDMGELVEGLGGSCIQKKV
ncbi:hypothetical protein JCGZ_22296 [Jatropha curcas]|uniref:Uncharacterized protein n=1 Tax=Jatropha curcas TaxID=180498 RepID=A0A067JQU5_JATCU|nr:hypothetical protein JCGZ_22296 [Jatropha curcas]